MSEFYKSDPDYQRRINSPIFKALCPELAHRQVEKNLKYSRNFAVSAYVSMICAVYFRSFQNYFIVLSILLAFPAMVYWVNRKECDYIEIWKGVHLFDIAAAKDAIFYCEHFANKGFVDMYSLDEDNLKPTCLAIIKLLSKEHIDADQRYNEFLKLYQDWEIYEDVRIKNEAERVKVSANFQKPYGILTRAKLLPEEYLGLRAEDFHAKVREEMQNRF